MDVLDRLFDTESQLSVGGGSPLGPPPPMNRLLKEMDCIGGGQRENFEKEI